MVAIDDAQIQALVQLLSAQDVPEDFEEPSVDLDIPIRSLPDLYFVLVAICHQTSPRGEPALGGRIDGKDFVGWDYLREAFLRAVRNDASLLDRVSLLMRRSSRLLVHSHSVCGARDHRG